MPTTVIAKITLSGSLTVENRYAKRVLERDDCMCVKFKEREALIIYAMLAITGVILVVSAAMILVKLFS